MIRSASNHKSTPLSLVRKRKSPHQERRFTKCSVQVLEFGALDWLLSLETSTRHYEIRKEFGHNKLDPSFPENKTDIAQVQRSYLTAFADWRLRSGWVPTFHQGSQSWDPLCIPDLELSLRTAILDNAWINSTVFDIKDDDIVAPKTIHSCFQHLPALELTFLGEYHYC